MAHPATGRPSAASYPAQRPLAAPPVVTLGAVAGGVGFCIGGVFWILPVLGLWMLPVGLVLLSEDIPSLRRSTNKTLAWLEGRMPHWFNHDKEP